MFATSPGCPAYLLKMRDYLCPSDSAQRARSQKRRFQFQKSTQKLIRFDNVSATVALVRLNNPGAGDGAAIAPRNARRAELVSEEIQN